MGSSVALLLSCVLKNEDFFHEIGNDENETEFNRGSDDWVS